MKKVAIIAAGHGGGNSGAVGQGSREAKETKQITNRAVRILKDDGRLRVVKVPNSLTLVASIRWVNRRFKRLDAGLAVEIHKNSAGGGADGGGTWYYSGSNISRNLARKMQRGLMAQTDLRDRGVHGDRTNRLGRLGWVRDLNPWSLLVEAGFISGGGDPISNEADQRYAEGVADGVLRCFGMRLKDNPKPNNNGGNSMGARSLTDKQWRAFYREAYWLIDARHPDDDEVKYHANHKSDALAFIHGFGEPAWKRYKRQRNEARRSLKSAEGELWEAEETIRGLEAKLKEGSTSNKKLKELANKLAAARDNLEQARSKIQQQNELIERLENTKPGKLSGAVRAIVEFIKGLFK